MAARYKRSVRRNEGMRDYLKDVEKTIQFATDARNVSRYMKFQNQQIASAAIEADSADMTVRFATPAAGFQILWAMATGKDKNAFMRGIQDKQVVIEGDMMLLMWFQKSMKYIR
jgi:hypothetical protein